MCFLTFTKHKFKGALTNTNSSTYTPARTKYKVTVAQFLEEQEENYRNWVCRFYTTVLSFNDLFVLNVDLQDLKIIWFPYFPTVVAVQFKNFCNKSLAWISHQNKTFQTSFTSFQSCYLLTLAWSNSSSSFWQELKKLLRSWKIEMQNEILLLLFDRPLHKPTVLNPNWKQCWSGFFFPKNTGVGLAHTLADHVPWQNGRVRGQTTQQ